MADKFSTNVPIILRVLNAFGVFTYTQMRAAQTKAEMLSWEILIAEAFVDNLQNGKTSSYEPAHQNSQLIKKLIALRSILASQADPGTNLIPAKTPTGIPQARYAKADAKSSQAQPNSTKRKS
jgi:hypothetical protein